MLVATPALAVASLVLYALGGRYTADFHWGVWTAARDLLHGTNPYPSADPTYLRLHPNSFVTPPPLAVLAVPFALLPFQVAVPIWNLLCVAALCLALRCVGVRDRRIYLLALASAPLIDSLENGQPDALFALAVALTWRYRDSWKGGIPAGLVIAAKLLAWPLVIWFLISRRFRTLWATVATAIGTLVASWALIGFKGLAAYPSLLAADAKAFEKWPYSYGLIQALAPLGLPTGQARIVAVVLALVVAGAIVVVARRSDSGWFTAALTFGVLSSPFLWPHYLIVLFIPLALARRRQLAIWICLAYSYWLMLIFLHTGPARAVATVAVTAALAAFAAWTTAEKTRGRAVVEGTVANRPPVALNSSIA